MKIVDVRQTTVPIASTLKNAYIDFSKMDVSAVTGHVVSSRTVSSPG